MSELAALFVTACGMVRCIALGGHGLGVLAQDFCQFWDAREVALLEGLLNKSDGRFGVVGVICQADRGDNILEGVVLQLETFDSLLQGRGAALVARGVVHTVSPAFLSAGRAYGSHAIALGTFVNNRKQPHAGIAFD